MQTHGSTPHDTSKYPDSQGFRYDTDLIKSEGERLLSAYLGRPGRGSGARVIWTCPRCGKQDKLSLQRASGAVGCWNAGCEVPDGTDVVGLIAHLEGLQTRGEDFKRVAALCYDLLGLPAPASPNDGPNDAVVVPAAKGKDSINGHSKGRPLVTSEQKTDFLASFSSQDGLGSAGDDWIAFSEGYWSYVRWKSGTNAFLASRGVALATARAGRFGSISAERAAHVVERLEREFGREELLDVPGFREDVRHGSRLGFTLWGDFLLIPYLDHEGRVLTIEGRAVGEVPKWAGKYTSLRNGGNHLYVFPTFRAEDVLAICEGPLWASSSPPRRAYPRWLDTRRQALHGRRRTRAAPGARRRGLRRPRSPLRAGCGREARRDSGRREARTEGVRVAHLPPERHTPHRHGPRDRRRQRVGPKGPGRVDTRRARGRLPRRPPDPVLPLRGPGRVARRNHAEDAEEAGPQIEDKV